MQIKKAGYNGILLPELKIGFDYSGSDADHIFISHAHADHMPRGSQLSVYATEHTIEFMKKRGFSGKAAAMPFGEPLDTGRARATFYPAGHILGSAMTYIESEWGTVLYTGDYRTPPSPATEGFELPEPVDFFITEATFSLPIYKWPSTGELIEQVRSFAQRTLDEGGTPLFLAYNLGKAQEIMHIVAPLDHIVQIHGAGYKLCSVYEEADIDLGQYEPYDRESCEGKILIAPTSAFNNGFASNVKKLRIAYCSGWAARESTRTQLTVDKLIPLSDHLDFFELIRLCKKLQPKKVFITHTPNAKVVRHYLDNLDIESVFLDLEAETNDE
ncbi:MAG: hypothetical protein R3224_00820, partial [Balneolaceae bacterium]|nr:hypothetical protein [Balneolaceae bacterium]